MLDKISKEQLKRLTLHSAGISQVLMEVMFPPDKSDWATGISIDELLDSFPTKPNGKDKSYKNEIPDFELPLDQPSAPIDWQTEECRRKEQALSRLCGRWIAGKNRCGVEISRAGEHFILTYLKRNGRPSDERYVLVWLDDDVIYYYGYGDRMTVLALNTESDTLMISPGADYTRHTEEIK
jgi:hypothetical protein